MKKNIPVVLFASICFFTSCKKNMVMDEKNISPAITGETMKQISNPCGMLEDAARTAAAKNKRTNASSQTPVVLLLDFDGQIVSNTAWNTNGPINFPAVSSLYLTAAMKDYIMQSVTEDYSGFSVKVTKNEQDYQLAPADRRMRCIITHQMGSQFPWTGIAYVNSLFWADNTPCLVFCDNLSYYQKYIAEAVAHEFGHTLGLYHQSAYNSSCQLDFEYNPGTGTGALSWAPIMGLSYYRTLSTWHVGTNILGCNQIQNDMDIIRAATGVKADDYSSAVNNNTTTLPSMGTQKGILETATDIDAFFKKETQAKRIKVTSDGNSDLALEIYNEQKQLIAVYDDPAGTDINVVISGKKYLKVRISSAQPFVPAGDGFGGYRINITAP